MLLPRIYHWCHPHAPLVQNFRKYYSVLLSKFADFRIRTVHGGNLTFVNKFSVQSSVQHDSLVDRKLPCGNFCHNIGTPIASLFHSRNIHTSVRLGKNTKNRPKSSKKSKGSDKKVVDVAEPLELIDVGGFQSAMDKVLDELKVSFDLHLSLRSHASSFEQLPIDFGESGAKVQLNHIAKVVMKNPQLVIISLTQHSDKVGAVADAISKSGLNVNVQIQGSTIYAPLPMVTREHRQKLANNAHKMQTEFIERLRQLSSQWLKKVPPPGTKGVSDDKIWIAKEYFRVVRQEYAEKVKRMVKLKQEELMKEEVSG